MSKLAFVAVIIFGCSLDGSSLAVIAILALIAAASAVAAVVKG